MAFVELRTTLDSAIDPHIPVRRASELERHVTTRVRASRSPSPQRLLRRNGPRAAAFDRSLAHRAAGAEETLWDFVR